jgi:hypothetical protein
MSFTPTVATLATAGAEKLRELPMSPYAFGAIAFSSFLVLLAVLWTFRNTAVKYDTPIPVAQSDPGDPQRSHGPPQPGAHH